MKKLFGILIIIAGFLATILLIIGTSQDPIFYMSGFSRGSLEIITWIIHKILPIAGFLLIFLPMGLFYIKKGTPFNALQKGGLILQFISIAILVLGFVPMSLCAVHSCDGLGEGILFLMGATVAGVVFLIGCFVFLLSWLLQKK